MRRIALFICLGLLTFSNTQTGFSQIAMNDWRIHFSAFQGKGIAATETAVFMACSNGIVMYDLEDNSLQEITVTNGLSDLGISAIESSDDVVVVGYANGNLDILERGETTNIPWIKIAEVSGDKTVHNFSFSGDLIYVSTGVGLIVIDNEKKEVKDTYYPYDSPVIYDALVHNDTLFAATEKGIYFAPSDRPFLNDLSQWEKKTDVPTEVVNKKFSHLGSYNDFLIMAYDDTLYNGDTLYFEKNGVMTKFEEPVNIRDLKVEEDRVLVTQSFSIRILDENMEQTELLFDYPDGTPSPAATTYAAGFYWITDLNHGMVKAVNSYASDFIYDSTPATDGSFRMDIQFGKVLVAGGGLTQNSINNFFRNGVYLFEEEEWTNFNYRTDENIGFDTDWDFISVAVNQSNTDEMAFASFSIGGLKIVRDGESISEVYTADNSVIEAQSERMLITDLKYDDDGNLWVLNKGQEPLKVFTPDGEQYSFSLGSSAKDKIPYRLLIDNEGNKWVGVTNVGLIAFNDNGTFEDTSDDQLRTLTSSEGFGALPVNVVKGLAQDADGEIWIGTEEGLVVLYSRTNLYDGGFGEYDASKILLEVDGETEKLLGETHVTSIAIDGGNRKWIGTSSAGVFCFSEDGLEEVYRFDTENSPLVSNNILDIKVDQLSGEVYFATDKGLVSFRSDATLADRTFDEVTVFPNPVHPDFYGPITIQGLGYESDVKITDVSGNVVYKGVSNGGTFIWNGETLQGDRVQSGVYLVWSAVTTGKGKNVAKILFIN